MQNNPRPIELKRTLWKTQLRRHDLEAMFSNRRKEQLTHNTYHQADHQHAALIRQLAQNSNQQSLKKIVQIVIQIDSSLQLLFSIAAIVPQDVPTFFANIISQSLGNSNLPSKIQPLDVDDNGQWLINHRNALLLIEQTFQAWQASEAGASFQKIKDLLGSMRQIDLAVNVPTIEFIILMTNILLVVDWVQDTLLIGRSPGSQHRENKAKAQSQLKSCQYILTNFLAGRDQLILPHVEAIFHFSCNNIKCVMLYFNIFLIAGVEPSLRLAMFEKLVSLLTLNSQQFMEQHNEFIAVIVNAVLSMSELPKQLKQSYRQVGLKLTELLSQLLKMVNLRYQNSSLYLPANLIANDSDDKLFVHHLSLVLYKLSDDKYILFSLISSTSVGKFIINNIEPQEHSHGLKVSMYLTIVLARTINEEYAFAKFLEQPRFIQKVLRILSKNKLRSEFHDRQFLFFLEQVLFIISNSCGQLELLNKYLQQNLMESVTQLYFKLPKTQIAHQSILECRYFYLNLIMGSKCYLVEESEQRQNVLSMLLGSQLSKAMFIQCLRSEQLPLVIKAIDLLAFLVAIEQKCSYNQHIEAFLNYYCLYQQLQMMGWSKSEYVSQLASKGLALLGSRAGKVGCPAEEQQL